MTLIPDLERDLVEAATRRQPRRRRMRAGIRLAATAAAAVAVVAGVTLSNEEDASERQRAPATRDSQPKPTLEGLLGVFRREPTPRDDYGVSIRELEATKDRQPGEDTTRSRRIDLAGGPVYLWPMRNGVCASWGNCLGLDSLQRLGVAWATESSTGEGGMLTKAVVSGIVVDGIDNVRLEPGNNGPLVIPVKDNVFRVDLTETSPLPRSGHWSYKGRERRLDLPFADERLPGGGD
jgi:hypothetical protein